MARRAGWLIALLALAAAWALPAQAQWKNQSFEGSPFALRGEVFRGASVRVRATDPDAKSVRIWEAIVEKPGERLEINYAESLGNLLFDKDPPIKRMELAGINARTIPGLTWGEAGSFAGGFGSLWHYVHLTMQASRPLSCYGFTTVVQSVAAGDKRGLNGVHCREGAQRLEAAQIEAVLRGIGVRVSTCRSRDRNRRRGAAGEPVRRQVCGRPGGRSVRSSCPPTAT